MKIISRTTRKAFEPIKFEMTIESEEEFAALLAQTNVSIDEVRNKWDEMNYPQLPAKLSTSSINQVSELFCHLWKHAEERKYGQS